MRPKRDSDIVILFGRHEDLFGRPDDTPHRFQFSISLFAVEIEFVCPNATGNENVHMIVPRTEFEMQPIPAPPRRGLANLVQFNLLPVAVVESCLGPGEVVAFLACLCRAANEQQGNRITVAT